MVRFTYHSDSSADPYKEVFILNPLWRGKVHALDLKRMTPAEVRVIQAIMDPETKTKGHPYALVNDILRRMDVTEEIKNPVTFYARMVRPFIKNSNDIYRTYYPTKMYGVQVTESTKFAKTPQNNKPLFHK
jgi:hypothetical protein